MKIKTINMKLTGAQILIETLIEQGVDVVFGYPGGSILNIHDALYDKKNEVKHILTSHEQAAAHAADGYARASGKTGVVIATSGPGATNLVTGIATAYMDSIPMVAITGNVSLDLLGRDSFQEVDICGITMPITKHNFMVKDVTQLADTVREAFIIAASGRPGPVLVDIPKDITAKTADYEPQKKVTLRSPITPNNDDILELIKLINECKKPLIYAGGGVVFSDASSALSDLVEKIDIPVALSMMGLSALPQSHPRNLGMIGMHGTPAANKAVLECDLLITIGARFSDRVAGNRNAFAKNAKIVHIDIDTSEQAKNVRVDLCVTGDAKAIIKLIIEKISSKKYTEWNQYLEHYSVHNPLPFWEDGEKLTIRHIVKGISKVLEKDAIIVTDVGQHQMITAQSYDFKQPRTFLSSGGLGTMGYGMGAAIGAKIAFPDRQVVLITGDGSFHMNLNELACAVSEKLPIVVIIVNNSVLGMVRQWQRLFYQSRYSNTDINRQTDFQKLADAFGANGYKVIKKSELEETIKDALKQTMPSVIECIVDKNDSVFPIIPPGGNSGDIIFCD